MNTRHAIPSCTRSLSKANTKYDITLTLTTYTQHSGQKQRLRPEPQGPMTASLSHEQPATVTGTSSGGLARAATVYKDPRSISTAP